jgi:hypothetical protein
MGEIYKFLGLTVGSRTRWTDAPRRVRFPDITYGTSSEFGFGPATTWPCGPGTGVQRGFALRDR